jgi:hypothetical protein
MKRKGKKRGEKRENERPKRNIKNIYAFVNSVTPPSYTIHKSKTYLFCIFSR